MKKSIVLFAAFGIVSGVFLAGCITAGQKVTKAQKNVAAANSDLDKANKEYLLDVENYRKKTAEAIETNNQSIAEFNVKIKDEKDDAKADYQKQIAGLEQKNADMKRKMDDYKVEGKDKWKTFKEEFSHDMDELGKAFKDLVVKNTN